MKMKREYKNPFREYLGNLEVYDRNLSLKEWLESIFSF